MALLVSSWVQVLGEDRPYGHIVVEFLFLWCENTDSICSPMVNTVHILLILGYLASLFHSLLQFRIPILWWWFTAWLYSGFPCLNSGFPGQDGTNSKGLDGFRWSLNHLVGEYFVTWADAVILFDFCDYLDYLFWFAFKERGYQPVHKI